MKGSGPVRRGFLAAVVIALVAAACSGNSTPTTVAEPTTQAPTTTTTMPPSTTTTVATATTVPPTTQAPTTTTTMPPSTTTTVATATTVPPTTTTEAAPVLDPVEEVAQQFDRTGDDLVAVVQAWYDLFNYLEHSPVGTADQMIDVLYTSNYHAIEKATADFAELVDNAWRYDDPGVEVIGVRVDQVDDTMATVLVAFERGVQSDGVQIIVDESGAQVKTYPGWPLRIQEWNLVRLSRSEARTVDRVPAGDESVEPELLETLDFTWIRGND